MLSIAVLPGVDYYLSLAGDYYLRGREPAGSWYGQGAAAAGLAGRVEKAALQALAKGFAPDGRPLVQNAGAATRQMGWDLTFSVPKSVSIAYALAPPTMQAAIEAAHRAAICAALDILEARCAWTRRGKAGRTREPARLVAALFEHGSSRAEDPQVHTHVLILNLGVRKDGTVGTVLSKPFYDNKMLLGALYRAELAAQLQQHLGLALQRKGPFFEIEGIPGALVRMFSTRRREIEAAAGARGIYSPAGMDAATLATRKTKRERSREELRDRWVDMAQRHGFTTEQVGALWERAALPTPTDTNALCREAVEQILTTQSHFSRFLLLRRAAELAPGTGLGIRALDDGVTRFLAQAPEIVNVGEDRYTTLAVARLEQELLDRAGDMQRDRRHMLAADTVVSALRTMEHQERQRHGKPFAMNGEQTRALSHILEQPGSLQLVSGMAGTGKTTLLAAARTAWEAEGFTVVGAALSGKAARGLEEQAGIRSVTLARLTNDLAVSTADDLGHHLRQLGRAAQGKPTWRLPDRMALDRRTILVVDEASMVGTAMMASLLRAVQRVGAKLVLCGDERQLQPIEAGGPFRALLQRLGGARLTGIVRQREVWAQEAVRQFARGEVGPALAQYQQRGLLHIAPTRFGAIETLLADWEKIGVARPEEALIFTATRADRALLNRMAQEARLRAGQLSLLPVCVNGTSFYARDRIVFTRNARLYGVENGVMGTVEAADPWNRTLQVRLDPGHDGNERWVTFSVDALRDIDLGYAITTHRGQGVSVENAFLLAGGPLQDREMTYVQASRSRQETRIYCDTFEAGPALTRLARSMQRSRPKDLALAPEPGMPGTAPRL